MIADSGRRLTAKSILIATTLITAQAVADPWPEKAFNPKPGPNDVVLPMPCDGAMVFRKVTLPLQKALDDLPIVLGSQQEDWGVLEGTYEMHVAGSFTETSVGAGRYYLMGKYEVSTLQYEALMKNNCLPANTKNRLPKTALSWFDAVQFADRYSQWLQREAAKQLPSEDGVAGFVRLPTEIEWSFAARGGVAVTTSEFQETQFPMDQPLGAYAWYAGPQSANGKLRPTGLLAPNPLGLHDILGNADEMMFEPFHMRTHGRAHGQAGGFVVRGGNYLTPSTDIRTSWRVEQPYYRDGQQNRLPTSGFRVVVVAPAITSTQKMQELQAQWLALGQGSDKQTADAANRIDKLAKQTNDAALEAELTQVRDQLRSANQLQQEQRQRAMRSSIQLGAFLCTELNQSGRRVKDIDSWLKQECADPKTEGKVQTCDGIRQSRQKFQQALDTVLGLYSDSIVELGSIYPTKDLNQQAQAVKQMLTARRDSNLDRYVDSFVGDLSSYIADRKVQKSAWLNHCLAIVK